MIITLSGTPGSGKSTVAKEVAKALKLEHYSTGGYYRKMAEQRNITVMELAQLAETDKSVDEELDQWQAKLGMENDNFIIDGRLSFHFIPKSIKVFLDASVAERAKRVFRDRRKDERNASIEAAKAELEERQASESRRYNEYYGLDYTDRTHYDLVIDTTTISAEEVVQRIVRFAKGRGVK